MELAGFQVVWKSYGPHTARGYRVKLQCQKHTEGRMTDNNNNNSNNIIWKISIQLTGVGLAHACPIIVIASFPGHSQILSHKCGEKNDFSPQLLDKIWEWPGNEAIIVIFGGCLY